MPGPGSRIRRSDLDGLPSPGIVDTLRDNPDWLGIVTGVPNQMGNMPVFVDRGNIWIPVSLEWEANPAGNSDVEWRNGIAYRPMYQVAGTTKFTIIDNPRFVDRVSPSYPINCRAKELK